MRNEMYESGAGGYPSGAVPDRPFRDSGGGDSGNPAPGGASGGSGLGLAIVKRNIESFDGTITVTDSVHGGTRFTVTFPSLSFDEEVDI